LLKFLMILKMNLRHMI